MRVLEILLELNNTRHTAFEKTVSHKTRHERAGFLRRFLRDLASKAGFPTVPDPRNLGQKHVHVMVQVWQREKLAPATIQTYLSFLRGLALWMGKQGFIRAPAHYGLSPAEYQRHETAQRDRSWTASGVDVEQTIDAVAAFDARVAASLRLMHVLALRRKEAVTFRPFADVGHFEAVPLPPNAAHAERYARIKGKGGRVRWLPLDTPQRLEAVCHAQSIVGDRDAHMGDPAQSLKSNLRRLDYAMQKFGLTRGERGVTMHGLRHGRLQAVYESVAGAPAPVCGQTTVASDLDREARQLVSETAGHSRRRAASAYLGSPPGRRRTRSEVSQAETSDDAPA